MRTTLAVVAALAVCVSPARAQPVADHLKCYKVKDPQARASYTADLGGIVAEPGCTIKVPAVMTCVPATKTNVSPTPPGGGATGTPNAFGCYKIKCPRQTLPALQLSDQFGTRSVTPTVPKLLCAPAAPPTTTTTTVPPLCAGSTYPACGGACPSGEQCVPQDRSALPGGDTFCTCVSPSAICGGACEFTQGGWCPPGTDQPCVITQTACGCGASPSGAFLN